MVSRHLARTGLAGAFALTLAAQPARAACGPPLPAAARPTTTMRPITAADIIQLAYVGDPESADFATPSPFAVSPDGKSVAYIVTRADIATNSYCRALVVSDITRPSLPRVIDRGGQIILLSDPLRGFYLPTGAPRVIVPRWSPDGRRIAYLRRDHDRIQAWVARADGSGAQKASSAPVDVQTIAWSADGSHVLYGTPHGAREEQQAVDREGERGWLYDERVSPEISARPAARALNRLDVMSVDLATGWTAKARPGDAERLSHVLAGTDASDPTAVSRSGAKAGVERTEASPIAPARLIVTASDGRRQPCRSPVCNGGIVSIWWDGDTIVYLRREGWDKESEALYRWRPGEGPPKRVMVTKALLHGCTRANDALICTSETSTTPRVVAAIDMRRGIQRVLFDPNPAFSRIALGTVRRLRYRNDIGLESWADLVLPPDYRPGVKLPMVVVQYHSRGFLEGGTGNAYPVFLLARRGFAVLSLERPNVYASTVPGLKDFDALNAANEHDWRERRSLLSSLMIGVRMAIAQGEIDPARIGITGLSDGATTAAFALVNTHAFAAAAISTCCMEPYTTAIYGGPAWANWLHHMGYPHATSHDAAFWSEMSLAQNAAHIDTPLLMQLSDAEFRLSLEAYGALREHNQPTEMYVFPDEYHVIWQPIHRLAIFERDCDWFSFWLQGREDPDPAKQGEYRRWRAMRQAIAHRTDTQSAVSNPAP